MSNKSAEAYEKVFNYIENNVNKKFKLKPTSFMADWEGGIRSAINHLYSDASLHGCWTHFRAAVRRNCSRYLLQTIADNPTAGTIYRMLLNLPLLPRDKIVEGFKIIGRIANHNHLNADFKKIFTYFQNYWLKLVIEFSTILNYRTFKLISFSKSKL